MSTINRYNYIGSKWTLILMTICKTFKAPFANVIISDMSRIRQAIIYEVNRPLYL